MSSPSTEYHKIWLEQCAANLPIRYVLLRDLAHLEIRGAAMASGSCNVRLSFQKKEV